MALKYEFSNGYIGLEGPILSLILLNVGFKNSDLQQCAVTMFQPISKRYLERSISSNVTSDVNQEKTQGIKLSTFFFLSVRTTLKICQKHLVLK